MRKSTERIYSHLQQLTHVHLGLHILAGSLACETLAHRALEYTC